MIGTDLYKPDPFSHFNNITLNNEIKRVPIINGTSQYKSNHIVTHHQLASGSGALAGMSRSGWAGLKQRWIRWS